MIGPYSWTLQLGGAPQQFTIEVIPQTGPAFPSVNVSFPDLPSGIVVTPSGQTAVYTSGEVGRFFILAGPTASAGQTTITIASTNGSVSHTNSIALTINPAATFHLSLAPLSLSLTPGAQGSVQVTVVPDSGQAPLVSLAMATMSMRWDFINPVTTGSRSGPFTLTFSSAFSSPPVSNFPVFITASDPAGNTSTAVLPISLTAPFPAIFAPTRSNFFRTDDLPAGVVYDAARKLLFTTLTNLNEVRVLSSVDGHLVATIPVASPGAVDELADGKAVFVGGLSQVFTIDPDLLEVTNSTPVSQPANSAPGSIAQPVQLVALSTGEVMLLNFSGGHIFRWNPGTGVITPNDPPDSTSVTSISRSSDRTKVFLTISASYFTASAVLYDAPSSITTLSS